VDITETVRDRNAISTALKPDYGGLQIVYKRTC